MPRVAKVESRGTSTALCAANHSMQYASGMPKPLWTMHGRGGGLQRARVTASGLSLPVSAVRSLLQDAADHCEQVAEPVGDSCLRHERLSEKALRAGTFAW
jgi:hypothetical protein